MGILLQCFIKCLSNENIQNSEIIKGSKLSRESMKTSHLSNISNDNGNIKKEMESDKKIFDEFNEMRKNPDSRKASNYENESNISEYFEIAEQQINENKNKIIELKWEDEIYVKIRKLIIKINDNGKINYDTIFELISKEKKPIKNKLYGQCEYKKDEEKEKKCEEKKDENAENKNENNNDAEKKAYKCLEMNPNIVLNVLTKNYSNLIVVSIPNKNKDLENIYFFFYDI